MDIEEIRADFSVLERKINNKPIVYFDNACMTLKPKQVIDAINDFYLKSTGCGGRSAHKLGAEVSERVEETRKSVSKFINSKPNEVIFTRNTTESINLVANSFNFKQGDVILTSDREHNSNLVPWQVVANKKKLTHKVVFSNPDMTFNLEAFKKELNPKVRLVSVVHTSNLDGYTLPVKEIIKLAHGNGSLVLVDAAQSAGHQQVDVKSLDADFVVMSGHKMLGPSGTGILYGKQKLLSELEPFIVGGDTVESTTYESHKFLDSPKKFEAGLQDYAGIFGLGAAVNYLKDIGFDAIHRHEQKLNKQISGFLEKLPGCKIIGPDVSQRSGITSFNIDGLKYHDIALMLNNLSNVMVRSGQHCLHSWFNAHKLSGSVRASVYLYNTEAEVETFISAMKQISMLR